MIRLLSLTAALALLPLSSALAQSVDQPAPAAEAAEARLDAAAEAFEARMEEFGERAEAISEDESLSEAERGRRVAALWAEYQPAVTAFTAQATQHAGEVAAKALQDIDVEALVQDALNDPEVKQAMAEGMAAGEGIARNSAWTNPDNDQMVTYGLIAQYALDQAADAVVEETAERPESPEAMEAAEAPEAPEAPEPPAPPPAPRRP